MSLLKRIESARPGGAAAPAAPPPGEPGPNLPAPASGPPPTSVGTARLQTQSPVRESFRDVKFRIQSRVIQDLDPKLDLSNQVEVRRQIEEIFGKVIDEEGLALTRAERVRMLEQITDEIIGLGPLEPGFDLLEREIEPALELLTRNGAWLLTLSGSPDEAIALIRQEAERLRGRATRR